MTFSHRTLAGLFLLLALSVPLSAGGQSLSPTALISPGPLTDLHTKYEGDCLACHELGKGLPDEKCLDCHKEIRERRLAKKGFHAQVQGKCFECHTDHKGRGFPIIKDDQLKPPAFNHQATGFPRAGKHAQLDCRTCHKTRSFLKLQPACTFCHTPPHKDAFKDTPCTDCHSFDAWIPPVAFRHEKAKFKLEGPHKNAPCGACHSAGVFRGRKHGTCAECHKDPHDKQFEPTVCTECHTVNGNWTPDAFRHEKAKFKREGPHKDAPCGACHSVGVFRGRKHDTCAECHKDPHDGLRGRTCTKCHRGDSWNLSAAVHAQGGFPLQGRHARLNCTECHKDKRFAVSGRLCASCHADPHRNQFGGTDCNKCHNAAAWIPPTFTHVQAGFVLDGRHRTLDCERCHAGRNYRNTPTQCDRCHSADFLRTASPAHQAAGIQGDCRVCHNTFSWRGAIFNHRFYPLAGPHNTAVRCNDCHVSTAVYNLNNTRCTVCHRQPVHPGHPNPDGDMPDHTRPHLHGHEPCAQCHYTDTWKRTRRPHM